MTETTASQPVRSKIPKDGFGPRGGADCYYTSRTLNSTFRYVKFVKKLRALEEEQRKGAENKLKDLIDKQCSDFFIRCDRRSLINNVARRVDLCMKSYQEDLKEKKNRLKDLLSAEEEANIRMFVEQAQAGAAALWRDKQDRLAYLLEKRKKEHQEKYKDTPLSKCSHILPSILNIRAREAQEIQLYQMKEKEAMRMAEKEMDKMWHEVAMKEAEALTARMEQDAIARLRRDQECKQYSDYQVEQRRLQRERERERLKQETLYFKSLWEADMKKEEEAERERLEKRLETARERKETIKQRHDTLEKQREEERVISETWDSLAGQGLADDKAKIELRKRKQRDVDECNKKMVELKKELERLEIEDNALIAEEAKRQQQAMDKIRCGSIEWARKTNADVRQTMVEQIKQREASREALRQKLNEQNEYHRQLYEQLEQLVKEKQLADARSRKAYQKDLMEQMRYNNVLKERARQEELDQIRKYQIATEEYQKEINRMLSRPFFSDELHPFMKQMARGLKMAEKCPCVRTD
ncbi:hypothetical protein ACJJTC_004282 [Scirpophaga incertulas]